ncbi:hypothetical protein BKA62DRAFT_713234 [Auriculariales sp. MPI-PUGE-AT-0066]|nr:hypothetical protein BKA62DRAFT_713234 [Auriculariales sp. MPI-PUGE-AT-0066]
MHPGAPAAPPNLPNLPKPLTHTTRHLSEPTCPDGSTMCCNVTSHLTRQSPPPVAGSDSDTREKGAHFRSMISRERVWCTAFPRVRVSSPGLPTHSSTLSKWRHSSVCCRMPSFEGRRPHNVHRRCSIASPAVIWQGNSRGRKGNVCRGCRRASPEHGIHWTATCRARTQAKTDNDAHIRAAKEGMSGYLPSGAGIPGGGKSSICNLA